MSISPYSIARAVAINETYMKVSSDPEVQEKIRKKMLAQTKEELYGILKAKRGKEFELAKSLNSASAGSSLVPGYKYSYSGADAKAWGYYPHKSVQLIKEKERLMDLLTQAEKEIADRSSNPVDSLQTNPGQFGDAELNLIRDRINSLPATTDKGWVLLDSLATLSLNIHEPRAQVRALGHKGIKGFAGSVRTIAGTMIFTIVEGHPLRNLMLIDDEIGSKPSHRGGWSIDNYLTGRGTAYTGGDKLTKLATMMTPFNIHIQYKTEYLPQSDPSFHTGGGMGAALRIEGIQIISEGIVTSVNDIVTEITYQFIAEDAKEFSGKAYAELVEKSPVLDIGEYSTEEILSQLNVSYDDLITSSTHGSSYEKLASSIMLDEINKTLGGTFEASEEEISFLRGRN